MPESAVHAIAVLISGQGRNLQALMAAAADGRIPARIAAVVSNRADAAGLQRARETGIPTQVIPHGDYPNREAFDQELALAIEGSGADAVLLAGFMRVLTPGFVRRFEGRLLNIHPSLLPKYPGLRTHERVLQAGESRHGATVHFVTEALDGGPAIIQGELSAWPDDTPQSLGARVMDEIELKIYPQAAAWLAQGELRLEHGTVLFRGRPLATPLSLADLEPGFR